MCWFWRWVIALQAKKIKYNFSSGLYLIFLQSRTLKSTLSIHLCLSLPLHASVFLMLYPGCPDEPL